MPAVTDVRDPGAHRRSTGRSSGRSTKRRRPESSAACASAQVEAVGVCLLFSTVNPAHELRVGELLRRPGAGDPVHAVPPAQSHPPRVPPGLLDGHRRVAQAGHERVPARARASPAGGRLSAAACSSPPRTAAWPTRHEVADAPIHALNSGPAMAPIAGRCHRRSETGHATVIVADTGGTTYDVSVVQRGRIPTTVETWIGPALRRPHDGLPLRRRAQRRRRRRQHRLGRQARAAPRRPAERGRRSGADLLRPRRGQADPHRRLPRPRVPRSGVLPRAAR